MNKFLQSSAGYLIGFAFSLISQIGYAGTATSDIQVSATVPEYCIVTPQGLQCLLDTTNVIIGGGGGGSSNGSVGSSGGSGTSNSLFLGGTGVIIGTNGGGGTGSGYGTSNAGNDRGLGFSAQGDAMDSGAGGDAGGGDFGGGYNFAGYGSSSGRGSGIGTASGFGAPGGDISGGNISGGGWAGVGSTDFGNNESAGYWMLGGDDGMGSGTNGGGNTPNIGMVHTHGRAGGGVEGILVYDESRNGEFGKAQEYLDDTLIVTYPDSEADCKQGDIRRLPKKPGSFMNNLRQKELTPGHRAKALCITNVDNKTRHLDIALKKWGNTPNNSHKAMLSTDLTIYPSNFDIKPGGMQLVRLVPMDEPSADMDTGYSLVFNNIHTEPQTKNSGGASRALPIVLKSKSPQHGHLSCKVSGTNFSMLDVKCNNASNYYKVITKIIATNKISKTNRAINVWQYLLPTTTSVYSVPLDVKHYSNIDLYAVDDGRIYKIPLK